MFPGAWSAGARIRGAPSGGTEWRPSGNARGPEGALDREAPVRQPDMAGCAGLGEDGGGGGGGSSGPPPVGCCDGGMRRCCHGAPLHPNSPLVLLAVGVSVDCPSIFRGRAAQPTSIAVPLRAEAKPSRVFAGRHVARSSRFAVLCGIWATMLAAGLCRIARRSLSARHRVAQQRVRSIEPRRLRLA